MVFRLFIALLVSSSLGCASKAINDHTTDAESIFVNSPDDVKDCKFVGLIEVGGSDDWKDRILRRAAKKGATHIYSEGNNNVARDKSNIVVSANAYRCKETLKKMNE